jgi:hypothetical protein
MESLGRSLRRIPFPPPLALPLAIVAMAVGLRTASEASDLRQWSAGERSTVSSPAGEVLAASVALRVGALEEPLGLAGAANRQVSAVKDLFHERQLHEVTYRDRQGRPIALVRLDPTGRLVSAVRLGYRDSFAQGSLDRTDAIARAEALAGSLGIDLPGGMASARPMMNGTLWAVTWARRADGIPVVGDGVTVRLWRSGDLHSVTVGERRLDRPTMIISPVRARELLDGLLPDLVSGERRADGILGSPILLWVAANDRFRPAGADAPNAVLRLAYVFEMRFAGESAALVRTVTFWIDAETGELIGGDVLR